MKRTAVNPNSWGEAFSMNQAEIVEGVTRTLRCAGQTALVEDPDAPHGVSVVGKGDMAAQVARSLEAVDEILSQAGMARGDIVFVHFYTTDVRAFMANYHVYGDWIGEAGIMPPQTVLGVAALGGPDLLVEIEVTAAV